MIYRFTGCELDVERRELRRDGSPEPVEPQVFDVLAYLIAHRDRVVTKEELLDNIWGDRFVSEWALTSRIKSARKAVGDSGQRQHVIRTVHSRGYHFVAPLVADAEPPPVDVRVVPTLNDVRRAWPLLGRGPELARVEDAFQRRHVGGVLLTGPAGVGKTRIALEALRRAEKAGVTVARVSGHPETKPLPLAAVAHLLPADVAQPVGPEGELDRAGVFHRARAAIDELTGGGRALALVDDVDQLDDLSRALLVSLVHARAVFMVITLRTPDGVDEGVARLVKDGHLMALDVAPLTADMVGSLLHEAMGGAVEDATVEQFVDASVGNPGVLRQLVESAWDSGSLIERDGLWGLDQRLAHVSPTLELLVAERLGALGDTEREAVELLAVAGELSLNVLAQLVDEDVLERLERRGLLQVVQVGARTEVLLGHPLFAEVLRAQLPPMRGRRLRRTLADAVVAAGADSTRDRVRVVAWRLEAGGEVDAELLAEAARLALVQGDESMAERILARADVSDRTPELVQLLAELKFRQGETAAVEELLASIDDDELDDQDRAQVRRRRVTNLFFGRGQFQEGVDLLTDALGRFTDAEARASLEAYHVLLLAMAGLVSEAVARSDDALATVTGSPRLELLRGRALSLAAAGRGEGALAAVSEGWQLHESLPADLDRPGLSLLLFTEVLALAELGRFADADAAGQRWLARRSDPGTRSWLALWTARAHLASGDVGALRRGLEPLVRSTRALGHGATERWALALVASGRILQGDAAGAATDLQRVAALEDGPRGLFHVDIDRAHAWLTAEREGCAAACARLHVAAADAGRTGKWALEAALLHDVVRFGDARSVTPRLAFLAQQCDGELVRGRAAHAVGAAKRDAAALTEAVAAFERVGATLLAAEAAVHLEQAAPSAAASQTAARLRQALPAGTTTPLLRL